MLDQNTFDEYEIYVQAANAEGPASPHGIIRRYGYAGEGGNKFSLTSAC